LAWLQAQGVVKPQVLLAAAAGRPLDALALAQAGVDAQAWTELPQAVARGQAGALAGWPVPQIVDALQKLCVDALALAAGAAPRYFPPDSLQPVAHRPASAHQALPALLDWAADLARVSRHDGHPWNEALLLDALLASARTALNGTTARPDAASHARGSGGFATLG
jgi:DNA polymerase-3 subunit delta'